MHEYYLLRLYYFSSKIVFMMLLPRSRLRLIIKIVMGGPGICFPLRVRYGYEGVESPDLAVRSNRAFLHNGHSRAQSAGFLRGRLEDSPFSRFASLLFLLSIRT